MRKKGGTMKKKMFRWVSTSVMVGVFACAAIIVFGSAAPGQNTGDRRITVYIQEVFDAKVTLAPFEGVKTAKPIGEVLGVKKGASGTITIPAQYLPGEFLLTLSYRTKESDAPYPSERIIYINKQDVELTVNPPYITNDEKTKFNAGETENTVLSSFTKENAAKRMQIELLRQFLSGYDRPKSVVYTEGAKEFEVRRGEYNAWLTAQTKKYQDLFVSKAFQFQYVPSMVWNGDEKAQVGQLQKNYFEGIDFTDPLITRLRELSLFMDGYVNLYGVQAATQELRESLFTEAGKIACEKAIMGDPKVCSWMVDYFSAGYETNKITKGLGMLKQYRNNPKCVSTKK